MGTGEPGGNRGGTGEQRATGACTQSCFFTKTFFHRDTVHRETCTTRCFCTQALQHRRVYTQTFLRRQVLTKTRHYMEKLLLHREAFRHMVFYKENIFQHILVMKPFSSKFKTYLCIDVPQNVFMSQPLRT